MNHPTLCFKKEAVLAVGNYNKEKRIAFEDLELELKILKKYGVVYNIRESLLLYRSHPEQLTYNGRLNAPEIIRERRQMIENVIYS
jgi:sulfur relay (sulfurtransferase) DsrF/TusC family protein